jgi:hypothetical protein
LPEGFLRGANVRDQARRKAAKWNKAEDRDVVEVESVSDYVAT